jgi:hypothetical protein
LGKLLVLPANVRPDWKVFARCKHSSLFVLVASDKGKKFYNVDTRQVPKSPEWFMSASSKIKVMAKNLSRAALVAEEATKYLAKR